MILGALLDLVILLITTVLDLVPDLPQAPEQVQTYITYFFDVLFSGFGLISVFIDWTVFKTILALWFVVFNFEHIYKLIMYVLKKIPFIGVK